MCGIVGVACKVMLAKNLVTAFQEMLFVDTMRGPHSTGVLTYNNNKKAYQVYKRALAAPDFLNLKKVDKLFSDAVYGAHVMLGHNRWATKGGINDDNAHPFVMGDVIGVHNGSLNRWAHHAKGYDVDSAALYDAISKAGSHDEVVEVIESIDGAFALVWVNTKEGTLHMVRNDERTLYTQKTNDGILWASEDWMLDMTVSRGKVPAFHDGRRSWFPQLLPKETYHVYDIATMELVVKREVEMPVKKPLVSVVKGGGATGKTTNVGTNLRAVRLRDTPQTEERILVEFDDDSYEFSKISAYGRAHSFITTSEFLVDVQLVALKNDEFKPGVYDLKVFRKEYDPVKADKKDESGVTLICRSCDAEYLGTKEDCLVAYEDSDTLDNLGYWVKKPIAGDSTGKQKQDINTNAPYYKGYGGVLMSSTSWWSMTADGCSDCGCALTPGNVYWANYTTPMCTDCAKEHAN